MDVTASLDKLGLQDDKESVKSQEVMSPSKPITEHDSDDSDLFNWSDKYIINFVSKIIFLKKIYIMHCREILQ